MDRPTETRRTGTSFVGAAAGANVRLPAGHPEGYIEGFANIYNSFADALATVVAGGHVDESTSTTQTCTTALGAWRSWRR